MNKPIIGLLVAGLVIAIAGIIMVFSLSRTESETGSFSPYAAEEQSTQAATNGDEAKTPTVGSQPKARGSKGGSDEDMLVLPHDELNRPGPTGDAAEARRIKNRRPRTDEKVGKQDELPAGQLDKDDVQAGIQAVRPLVKACYEDMLKEFPDAAGKVTVAFRIIGEDNKGRVEMSELAEDNTTLFDQQLHDCMQKSIAEAEFETPSGGGVVNVRYPFVFQTDEDE